MAKSVPKTSKTPARKGPLSTKQRNGLPSSSFALPGRRYPIDTPARARNALARGAQNASPAEQAIIKRKVAARYPSIQVGGQ